MLEMAVRFMSEAWVLLRRGAGDVICSEAGVESEGAVLSFGAEGEENWGMAAVLARAAGDRFKWEAWMALTWVFSCGVGGGEVTIVLS